MELAQAVHLAEFLRGQGFPPLNVEVGLNLGSVRSPVPLFDMSTLPAVLAGSLLIPSHARLVNEYISVCACVCDIHAARFFIFSLIYHELGNVSTI